MLHRTLLLLAMVAAIASQARADEPAKLAESARFDLMVDASVKAIEDGRSIAGGASIERMNWVPEAERTRGYTVHFPVSDRRWRRASVRFTPAHSGNVTVTLMGPWQEASKGVLYRQELFWDDVRVAGASLADGGFEPIKLRESRLPHWQGAGTIVPQAADVPAVEGMYYARTWHNQPLSTTIKVSAGVPVTIALSARAVRPKGFVEMKRIAGRNTPAHRAARRFLRGANLGNGLEVPPDQTWGVHHTPADLRHLRDEGFDHARIPIGWHHYTGPGPEFRIQPAFFARVDELVDAGLEQGLGVLINIHHFDDFTTDPKKQTPRFLAIWGQIAAHYARSPEGLAFELLNEPKDAATTEVMNPIYAEAIRRIRKTDPRRTIFVGPGRWNTVDELNRLRLPDDDENLIVTVHNYDPFYFTHQGATWAGDETKITGIHFPGPPRTPLKPDRSINVNGRVLDWIARYNSEPTSTNPCAPHIIRAAVDKAREWSEYYGRPIHVGEFGCFTRADPESRANYYRAFREAAEKAGMGWAIWDWKAGFRYWDEEAGRPEPGMHAALFGRPGARTGP